MHLANHSKQVTTAMPLTQTLSGIMSQRLHMTSAEIQHLQCMKASKVRWHSLAVSVTLVYFSEVQSHHKQIPMHCQNFQLTKGLHNRCCLLTAYIIPARDLISYNPVSVILLHPTQSQLASSASLESLNLGISECNPVCKGQQQVMLKSRSSQ